VFQIIYRTLPFLEFKQNNLKQQRIVITGGPSTGKTTLIEALKKKGYRCFDEISREVIQEYQAKGISQPFVSHPQEFSDQLFLGRIRQYTSAENLEYSKVFYDRGIHDVIAYLNHIKEEVPQNYIDGATSNKYSTIFILSPWESIYTKDSERFESFEEAKKIHQALIDTYTHFGYSPIEVPFETIENRVSFILNTLK